MGLGRRVCHRPVESPDVGERIIEQRMVVSNPAQRKNHGPTQHLNTRPKQGWEGFKYLLTRSSRERS